MYRIILAIAILFGAGIAVNSQTVQNPPVTALACAYNSAPPTLNNGTFGLVQCNDDGTLITSGGGGGGGDVNLTEIAGNAVATDAGNTSAGTLRVIEAADSPLLTSEVNGCTGAPNCTNAIGNVGQNFRTTPALTSTVLSFNSSGDNTAITRTTGTIKVYGLMLACASSVVTTIKNGAGTGLTGAMTMTSLFLPISSEPYFVTTSTNNFIVNLGSGVQCSGTAWSLES